MAVVTADYLVHGEVWPCILIHRQPYILQQRAERLIRKVAGDQGTSHATINRWMSTAKVRTHSADVQQLRFYKQRGLLAPGSSVATMIRLQDVAKFLRYKIQDAEQQHPRLLAQLEEPTAAVQLPPHVPTEPSDNIVSAAAAAVGAVIASTSAVAAQATLDANTSLRGTAALTVASGSMLTHIGSQPGSVAGPTPRANAANVTSVAVLAPQQPSMLTAATRHLPNMKFTAQQLQPKRYKLPPNHHMMPVINQQLQQMQRFLTTPIDLARPKEQNCIAGQTWDTIKANVLRYLGFINKHADQPVASPTLHHYLQLDLVKQYVEFLRQRLCIPATLAEQVDVAHKVVTWLWRDHQLQGTAELDAQVGGLLQLLDSLRCQIHHNLPRPRPRKPPRELVTAEHLTLMLVAEYDIVMGYVNNPKALGSITIAQCARLMQLCLATCFWAFIEPVRPAGVSSLTGPWHTGGCEYPGCHAPDTELVPEPVCKGNRIFYVDESHSQLRVELPHLKTTKKTGFPVEFTLPAGLTPLFKALLEVARPKLMRTFEQVPAVFVNPNTGLAIGQQAVSTIFREVFPPEFHEKIPSPQQCRHLFVDVIRRTRNRVIAPFSEHAAALVMNNSPATWSEAYDQGRPDREMQEAVDGMQSIRQQLCDMARSEQQQVPNSTPAAIGRDGAAMAVTAQAWVTSAEYVSDCSDDEESDSSSDAEDDSADESDEPDCMLNTAPPPKPSTSRAALQLSYVHSGIVDNVGRHAQGPTFPQRFTQLALVHPNPPIQVHQHQSVSVQQSQLLGSQSGGIVCGEVAKHSNLAASGESSLNVNLAVLELQRQRKLKSSEQLLQRVGLRLSEVLQEKKHRFRGLPGMTTKRLLQQQRVPQVVKKPMLATGAVHGGMQQQGNPAATAAATAAHTTVMLPLGGLNPLAGRMQQQVSPVPTTTTAAAAAHAALMLPLGGLNPMVGLAADLPPLMRHTVMGLSLAPGYHDEDAALLKEVEDLIDVEDQQYLSAAADMPEASKLATAAADVDQVLPHLQVAAEEPDAMQGQQAVARQEVAADGVAADHQVALVEAAAADLEEAAAADQEAAAEPHPVPPADPEDNEAADDVGDMNQDHLVEDMALDAAAAAVEDLPSSDIDVSDTDSDGDSAMSVSSDGSEPAEQHDADEDFVIDLISSEEGNSELESSDDLMLLCAASDDYDLAY